jgi:hypothetical protein
MSVLEKLDLLRESYTDEEELDRVLEKLLNVVLNQHRLRLERYERDLRDFEKSFGMDSADFYARFEAGELGDDTDFFEWSGLCELRRDLLDVIARDRSSERAEEMRD